MRYNPRGSAKPLRFRDIKVGSFYVEEGREHVVYVKISDNDNGNAMVFDEDAILKILVGDMGSCGTHPPGEVVRIVRNCELVYDV